MAVHKHRGGDLSIRKHEGVIRQYLYDEGPSTTDDLVAMLGISKARTTDILTGMRAEGIIATSQLRGNQSFWLLAEDAEAQDAA
jgi:CRP-like cAMP-binding protein